MTHAATTCVRAPTRACIRRHSQLPGFPEVRTPALRPQRQRRCGRSPAAVPPQAQELIAELARLDDESLTSWAASNRGELTLELLTAIAHQQAEAAAEERQRLWALGSTLMAVREGLVPVGNEVLQEELRVAALRACQPSALPAAAAAPAGPSSTSTSNGASSVDGGRPLQQQTGDAAGANTEAGVTGVQLAPSPPQQQAQPGPGLSFVVQRTAQLGLTPEGLTILQQQAAGLEAVVGTSKARSLAEVIGRKELAAQEQEQQLAPLFEPDAAARILQLLVSLPDRAERAALLPDAFTPAEGPGSEAAGPAAAGVPGVDADVGGVSDSEAEGQEYAYVRCEEGGEEEELLSTTPLALLQAIDLQLSRLERPAQRPPGEAVAGLLKGGTDFGDLPLPELTARLRELREDVAAYWGELGNTSGEEF